MSKTLAQMASAVLRDVQIPEDATAPSILALADAKVYLNERARDVWKRRVFPEYLILGSYTIPASTRRIALSNITPDSGFTTSARGYNASFYDVVAIREGTNQIIPEDPGAVNRVQTDFFSRTTSPNMFVNLGQSGIFLNGYWPTATVLNFIGKAAFQDLTDSETWIIDNENCLIAGATGDMIRDFSKDDQRAMIRYQEYEAEIAKIIDNLEGQSANKKRVIPYRPWTRSLSLQRNFSVIGMNTNRT